MICLRLGQSGQRVGRCQLLELGLIVLQSAHHFIEHAADKAQLVFSVYRHGNIEVAVGYPKHTVGQGLERDNDLAGHDHGRAADGNGQQHGDEDDPVSRLQQAGEYIIGILGDYKLPGKLAEAAYQADQPHLVAIDDPAEPAGSLSQLCNLRQGDRLARPSLGRSGGLDRPSIHGQQRDNPLHPARQRYCGTQQRLQVSQFHFDHQKPKMDGFIRRVQRDTDRQQGDGIIAGKHHLARYVVRPVNLTLPVIRQHYRAIRILRIRGRQHPPIPIQHDKTTIGRKLSLNQGQVRYDILQMRIFPLLACGIGLAAVNIICLQIVEDDKGIGEHPQIVPALLQPEADLALNDCGQVDEFLFDLLGGGTVGHVIPEPAHADRGNQRHQDRKNQDPVPNRP